MLGKKKVGAAPTSTVAPKLKPAMAKGPIPVTLLSGFLGSGKTTLLEHILHNKEGLKCAVIVNDMAAVNIDADRVVKATANSNGALTDETVVELSNGCVCCSLRTDLLSTLRKLALSGGATVGVAEGSEAPQSAPGNGFDLIVVESTGISNPREVAELFFWDMKKQGGVLNNIARLDNCVTVVDASTFADNLSSVNYVEDDFTEGGSSRMAEVSEESKAERLAIHDDRNISHLLVDQVEFANVVLVNKCDIVPDAIRDDTVALVHKLNPAAKVLTCSRSQVELKHLLFTESFSPAFAYQQKGWASCTTAATVAEAAAAAEKKVTSSCGHGDNHTHGNDCCGRDADHEHNAEGCGSSSSSAPNKAGTNNALGAGSFVYRASRPFHPGRLGKFLTSFFMLQEGDGTTMEGACASEAPPATTGTAETTSAAAPGVDRAERETEVRAHRLEAAKRREQRLREIGHLYRSKGYVWVGTPARLGSFAEWNHAGSIVAFGCGGGWGLFPKWSPSKKAAQKQAGASSPTGFTSFYAYGDKSKEEPASLTDRAAAYAEATKAALEAHAAEAAAAAPPSSKVKVGAKKSSSSAATSSSPFGSALPDRFIVEKVPTQEIVFIGGESMKQASVVTMLDECLLTEEEEGYLTTVMTTMSEEDLIAQIRLIGKAEEAGLAAVGAAHSGATTSKAAVAEEDGDEFDDVDEEDEEQQMLKLMDIVVRHEFCDPFESWDS